PAAGKVREALPAALADTTENNPQGGVRSPRPPALLDCSAASRATWNRLPRGSGGRQHLAFDLSIIICTMAARRRSRSKLRELQPRAGRVRSRSGRNDPKREGGYAENAEGDPETTTNR